MPKHKSDSKGNAHSVSPSVLDPAKEKAQSAKTVVPSQSVVQPVQNVVHPLFSHSLWLWLGLVLGIMVIIMLGGFAYGKFKFGRKSPLGKRNDRMTNQITERQKFSTSLQELQQAFNDPKGSSTILNEYDKSLRTLESYRNDLVLNNLSQNEKDAFDLCIKECGQYCKQAKTIRTGSRSDQHNMIQGHGKEASNSIDRLVNCLSGNQSVVSSGHASFETLRKVPPTQNVSSTRDKSRASDVSHATSTREANNSVAAQLNRLVIDLNKEKQLVVEQRRTIDELETNLSKVTTTAQLNGNKLSEARASLKSTKEDLEGRITDNAALEKKLEEQKASREKLEGLTSPRYARGRLPQEAASWSELDNYVQNLLGFAELTDRHDLTAITAKLNELQRILFSPPPMNSLFDPVHPAPVDIFTRILYLQADLRSKLMEQGIQIIMPATGEAFDTQRHECAEADLVWDHEDQSKHNTIYAVRTIGFEDGNSGRVLKKAAVKKRMFDGTLPPEGLAKSMFTHAAPSELTLQETAEIKVQELPVSSAAPEEELQAENSQIENSSPLESTGEPTQETVPDKIAVPDELGATTIGVSELKSIEFSDSTSTEAETLPVSAVSEEIPDAIVGVILANGHVLNDPVEERRQRAREMESTPEETI